MQPNTVGGSNMVRIGIVGIGFMGMIHYLAAQKLRGGAVTAICSRDLTKLSGDWRGIRGNFGPPGEQMNLDHLTKYSNYDDMLDDPDIDMIDICNPTGAHPSTAIKALNAGKHVLVEKAIALSVADADKMVSVAQNAGKFLMVAHVLPFFPEFRFAYDANLEKRYGKLLGGHFKRVISKPDWSSAISDAAAMGGPAVDLHIHDTHYIGLLAGVPKAVQSVGLHTNGIVNYLSTAYHYPEGGPTITCTSGAIAAAGRPFAHGYELYFEQATLSYDSGGVPLTVYQADGSTEQPTLGSGDAVEAFTAELQTAADGVANNQLPPLLSAQLARDALALCHAECQSVVTGQVVPLS
jgi:predicted dehydrogenase